MDVPVVRFTRTADGSWVAFAILGEGELDLVFVAGWVSNLDLMWEHRSIGPFLRRLSERCRLIVFDRRGSGVSERSHAPTLDVMMDDVRAVMDAAGSERAVLVGGTLGGGMGALFAATFPERTQGLVLIQSMARVAWAPDYPWGESEAFHRDEIARIAEGWGSGTFERWFLERITGTVTDEDVASAARYLRNSMARGAAIEQEEIWFEIDFRHVLPAVRVPTLVIDRMSEPVHGRYLAEHIAGAELVHLPQELEPPWEPGSEPTVAAITRFLDGIRGEQADLDRVLATVMFTDIVDSTARAASVGDREWRDVMHEHDRIVRGLIGRFRGREVKTLGDGFLATFDGPARAIRCATAAVEAVRPLGIEIRAGLHTGEVELQGDDVAGVAVAIGARVGALAGPSSVLVSSTVKDLVAGSGLGFEDAGPHELKGVPDRWHLFRVVSP